jgi:Putative DNA-binding domain
MKTIKLLSPQKSDNTVPSLSQIQSAVSEIIMRPLGDKNRTQKKWPEGRDAHDTAAQYIKPNGKMSSLERLQIYNRQYWLRLIDCLEEDFPGVQSLLGRKKFRALAAAYLQTYPSTSFLLKEPSWGEQMQELLLDVARLEWAQAFALDAEHRTPLKAAGLTLGDPMHLVLVTQPHLVLLKLNYPADTFVDGLEQPHTEQSSASINNKEDRQTLPVPATPKRRKLHLVVFRADNRLYSKRLSPPAFAVLQHIKDGLPLGEACTIGLADYLDDKNGSKIQSQLANWFRTWTELEWFCA